MVDSVWKLLKKFQFNIDLTENQDLVYIICRNLLNNPHKRLCKCKYCLDCFKSYYFPGVKYCHGKSDNCNENILDVIEYLQFYKERSNKIIELIVNCPLKSCKFQTALKHMEQHLSSNYSSTINENESSIDNNSKTSQFDNICLSFLFNKFDDLQMKFNFFQKKFIKHIDIFNKEMEYLIDTITNNSKKLASMKEIILKKNLLIEAKQAPCACRFCGNCIEDYLSKGNSLCPGNTTECNDEVLHINENISNDHVTNRKISKLKLKCPSDNCIYEDILSNMDQYLTLCGKPSVVCPFSQFGCNQVRNDKDEITQHLQLEIYEHSQLIIGMIANLKNEVSILRKDNELLKSKSEEQQRLIENLELEINEIKENSCACNFLENEEYLYFDEEGNHEYDWSDLYDEDESSDDSNEQDENDNNQFISKQFSWIFSEFANKQNKRSFDSPDFYTHTNGYRMQLRLLPRCKTANCSGVTIYPNCIQGNNDRCLAWPLECEITIGIIDQSTGLYLHKITRFVSYENSNRSRVSPFEFPLYGVLSLYENGLKVVCNLRIIE